MLNIWRLQLLVQLYNLKTMKAVSESLRVSPATVSSQLNLLERETESILFEKHGRSVRLTSLGVSLAQRTQPILDQLERVNNNFTNVNTNIQGNVRITGFSSSLQSIIIPVIIRLKDAYPQINITFTETNPEQSITALNTHQFDLAIVAKFDKRILNNNQANQMIEIGSDKLKLLISTDNKLSNLKSVNISQLHDQNLILEDSNDYVSKYIDSLYFKNSFKPKVLGITKNYYALQNVVTNDLAIGVLPSLSFIEASENIKLVDLEPAKYQHVYLLKRKPQSSVPAIKIVSQAIENISKEVFSKIN